MVGRRDELRTYVLRPTTYVLIFPADNSSMQAIDRVRVLSREGAREVEREDLLAVEEPLEIRLRRRDGTATPVSFVTTMRTPGNDEELAAGLLYAEGVVTATAELGSLDRPSDPRVDPALRANVVVASVDAAAFARGEKLRRGTVMGSACGVCGRTSIENTIPADCRPLETALSVTPDLLFALTERFRPAQSVFSQTGGLHAAALFDREGALQSVREDVGRHNAVDKLVGAALLGAGLPLADRILMVSGRAGFEIVQKAYAAGIPFVASVSAPSSLAVDLADAAGVTLVGFLRERRYNVYAHPARIRSGSAGSRAAPETP